MNQNIVKQSLGSFSHFFRFFLLTVALFQCSHLSALTPTYETFDSQSECPFCCDEVIRRQQYYESDHFRVLYNYQPVLEGHSMVMPKRHIKMWEELTSIELEDMHRVMRLVQAAFTEGYGTGEYLMCCQNGLNAGQTVAHLHLHMIPRQERNVWTKLQLWAAMLGRPLTLYFPLNEEQLNRATAPLKEVCDRLEYEGF